MGKRSSCNQNNKFATQEWARSPRGKKASGCRRENPLGFGMAACAREAALGLPSLPDSTGLFRDPVCRLLPRSRRAAFVLNTPPCR